MFSLISHLLSAWFAFLLPSFSTFKALSHRPLSEPELEKWSKYWTVIGALLALEYVAEPLISWFPFYWEFKTLFLLFLSLPQTEGSTYVYDKYLQPFFVKNEAELDAGIVNVHRTTFAFVQTRLSALLEFIWGFLNKAAASRQQAGSEQSAPAVPSFSLDAAMSLLKAYGPALTRGQASPPPANPTTASTTSFQAPGGNGVTQQVRQTSDGAAAAPAPSPPPQTN